MQMATLQESWAVCGLDVLGDGNQAVIQALRSWVFAEGGTLRPQVSLRLAYEKADDRATEQWFASVEGFREEALLAIASVKWIQGENRITAMVSERSDWCISRQRSWGVPFPFSTRKQLEALLTEETIAHVQAIVAEKGSDAWWELPVEELLPEQYNNGRSYRKGTYDGCLV